MIARIEERQINIAKMINDTQINIKEHVKDDQRELAAIRGEISSMNKYGASIAIVAGAVGACATYIWSKITGQS